MSKFRKGQTGTLTVHGELVGVTTHYADPVLTFRADGYCFPSLSIASSKCKFKLDEPEYEEGCLYKDANDDLWLYQEEDGEVYWVTFGTDTHWDFDYPERPLTPVEI